jgi:hypothetical protein
MLSKIIKNFVAKMVAGRSDDGIMITLSDPRKVDFQAAMMEDLLMRNGIDPNAITSEAQLKTILNQIEAASKQTTSGIRNTESAKVFDLEGKEIPKGSKIMSGEEMPPPGSRGGPNDIAAPVQSAEETLKNMTEAEIKANLEAQNRSAIKNILKRKNREDVYGLEDYDTTNMSEIKKEIIRTETKLGNLNPNLPGFRERAKPLIDKITALQKKLREDKADGGRIGLKGGADASQFGKSPSEQRSVDISPSGSVTLGSGPPEGPDDRGSDTQNAVQAMVRAGFTPKEINAITNPTLFDKVKQSRFNNPLTRGILRTGAYLYNPSLAGIDFRRAMQAKDLYDYTMNQINNPQITEEDMQFAKGGRAGFFMGSKFPKGLATLREMVKFFSKGKDKERSGSEILKLVNPKQFNKLLEDPNIYRKFDVQKGIGAPELIKNMQADLAKNRTMMVEEILGAAKNIRKADVGTMERKKEMIEEMMRRGIDRETAEEMANTLSTMAEAAAGMRSTPKLTDEGILELENILKNMETGGKDKRSLNADGGRIGFKDGMNRRTFLKLLGGLASIPIVGKLIKPLKTVKGVKNVPIIKTDNIPGKPEWFDQLVNKVIIEGDDVTKRFATGERQSIHQKTLDDGSVVRVTEDVDDGAVRVEYESEANVYGDPVQMQYKKPKPDEGDPSPSAEFTTAESGPVGRADGPDDYSIEIDEVGGSSIKDLDSDVSKLKEYATGKGPTMKEIVQNKKRKDKAARITEGGEGEMDAVIRRQGEFIENDLVDLDPPDLASGGIARMLGE